MFVSKNIVNHVLIAIDIVQYQHPSKLLQFFNIPQYSKPLKNFDTLSFKQFTLTLSILTRSSAITFDL